MQVTFQKQFRRLDGVLLKLLFLGRQRAVPRSPNGPAGQSWSFHNANIHYILLDGHGWKVGPLKTAVLVTPF